MRVILATDGSKDASAAAAWLAEFPLPAAAAMLVLTAVHVPRPLVEAPATAGLRESMLADARRIVDETTPLLGNRGQPVTARVIEGDPRDVIVRTAEEWGANLVVLGARGLGAVAEFLLGSVSLGVARHAPCPVLVVKGSPRPLGTALVAVDGSPDSLAALRWFTALPLGAEMRIRVLSVVERIHFPSTAPRAVWGDLRAAMEQIEAERRAELDRALTAPLTALRERVRSVELSMPSGQPVEEIVGATDDPTIDLVVVGARGLGAVKRFFLGSVSERVLRHARCPVLIVRERA